MPDYIRQQTARLALAIRTGDLAGEQTARRDLLAEKVAYYARKEAAKAPPLTDEQCARIVAILRPPQPVDEVAS